MRLGHRGPGAPPARPAGSLATGFASVLSFARTRLFDRDSTLAGKVIPTVEALGIKPRRIAYRSPWQNGVAERWVGICRRELLDRVIVLHEGHLRRLLRDYVEYYSSDRCHLGLKKDTPEPRMSFREPQRRRLDS